MVNSEPTESEGTELIATHSLLERENHHHGRVDITSVVADDFEHRYVTLALEKVCRRYLI